MPQRPSPAQPDINRLAEVATLTVFVVASAAILILYFVSPIVTAGAVGFLPRSEIGRALAISAVYWSPAMFYLAALLSLSRLFAGLDRPTAQERLSPRAASLGRLLLLGAATSVLIQPNLLRLSWIVEGVRVEHRYGLDGGFAAFDLASLAVGGVGLALILLSKTLKRAANLQQELAQFI